MTFDAVDKLLWLLLGWLFGLLSPGIAERIRRKHRRVDVARSVKDELSQLRYLMAVVAYTMRARSAQVSDDFLDWLRPIVRNYRGPEANSKFAEALDLSRSKLTEEQRRAIDTALNSPTRGLAVKQQFLPVVEAMTSELSICPLEFQRRVLQIKN